MNPVRQAFVGVGSNIGDRCSAIRGAMEALYAIPTISVVEPSAVWESDPVGYLAQPLFLNAVFGLETTLLPEELLATIVTIEGKFGRTRPIRWGPRTLDLDLLAYENETRTGDSLSLPHPRALERGFVTVPWAELLRRTRFQQHCWATLRERVSSAQNSAGLRPFPNCHLEPWERIPGATLPNK